MDWRRLSRFVWVAPEDRWDGDLLFGPLAVFLGGWIGLVEERRVLGLDAFLVVWMVRELAFHFLVRKRRNH